jgi:hypothetical protein
MITPGEKELLQLIDPRQVDAVAGLAGDLCAHMLRNPNVDPFDPQLASRAVGLAATLIATVNAVGDIVNDRETCN